MLRGASSGASGCLAGVLLGYWLVGPLLGSHGAVPVRRVPARTYAAQTALQAMPPAEPLLLPSVVSTAQPSYFTRGPAPPPSPVASRDAADLALNAATWPPPPPPPPQLLSTAHAAASAHAAEGNAAGAAPVERRPVGPFDLDSRDGLRAAIAARADRGDDIVLFTSDVKGLPAAANLALQLARHRIHHHLVLADARTTCEAGHARWAWLGCGHSAGLDGFVARYGGESKSSRALARLWSLWSAKWLVVARLAQLRINVLALDTDVMVLEDPYPLIRAAPVSHYGLILPPEGGRVNLGFIYVRPATSRAHLGRNSGASRVDRPGRHRDLPCRYVARRSLRSAESRPCCGI